MFRTAELGQKIPKSEYKQRVPVLRQELLEVQAKLSQSGDFPVIIVFIIFSRQIIKGITLGSVKG